MAAALAYDAACLREKGIGAADQLNFHLAEHVELLGEGRTASACPLLTQPLFTHLQASPFPPALPLPAHADAGTLAEALQRELISQEDLLLRQQLPTMMLQVQDDAAAAAAAAVDSAHALDSSSPASIGACLPFAPSGSLSAGGSMGIAGGSASGQSLGGIAEDERAAAMEATSSRLAGLLFECIMVGAGPALPWWNR